MKLINKRKRKPKGKLRKDNPETPATLGRVSGVCLNNSRTGQCQ